MPLSPLSRRFFLGASLSIAALPIAPRGVRAEDPIRVKDLLGREIVLQRPARRIVIAHGRLLNLVGLLHPSPADILAGWAGDMRSALPIEYAAWRKRFPALDAVPVIGRQVTDDVSVESILAVQPDLVVLTRTAAGPLDAKGKSARIELLASAGLQVAVVDCLDDPLRDTVPSIEILGALLGRREQATALSAFYTAKLTAIHDWVRDNAKTKVSVLVHRHAGGKTCCWSVASGSFADFVTIAGGHSIAADVLKQPLGQLNLEYVVTHPPDVYLATGGVYAGRGGLSLGAGVSAKDAASSLVEIVAEPGIADLPAVKAGRAFGVWHGFNETPLHIVALEAMLGWLHPESRTVFDPAKTLATINERFSALPIEGAYWTGLAA